MNTELIKQVIKNEALPDTCKHADYVETPNAWIIRSDNHAFKIRKRVQANGKELSTLEERKNMCLKEFKLNKPLGGKTYESVVTLNTMGADYPAYKQNDLHEEHAVKMKLLHDDNSLLKHVKKHDISEEHIIKIADTIAQFHKKANRVKNTFNITGFQNEFEEIKRCENFVLDVFGPSYVKTMHKSIEVSKRFLNDNRYYIQERTIEGFIRDGHGNLEADKIFFNHRPIVIDRVVIDDEKRKVDVLFDIALVGINLDFYGYGNFDEEFLKHYINKLEDQYSKKTKLLYAYYKLYRTGQLITKKLDRNTIFSFPEEQKHEITRYFELIKHYMEILKNQ